MTTNPQLVGVTAAPEWPETLDIHELIAGGWRPTPFREFVLKIHSRCDLACDYCYMYKMADQSWWGRPRTMSLEVLRAAAYRIAEHAHEHGLDTVEVILHGGEPLLAGPEYVERAVTAVREAADGVRVDATVQTNGVRLDDTYLDLFDRLDMRIGLSVDGDAAAHDRHRRRPSGRGSYHDVQAALTHLTAEARRHLLGGLLCTIDLRNDPLTTYEALVEWGPPAIDFLLPHGNWATPPPGRLPDSSATPYADWLIPVFDRWYRADPVAETEIRLFSELIRLRFGGASTTEGVGLSPVGVVIIETDGAIEQSDFLKSAYPGAPSTGLRVTDDPIDSALLLPGVVARQIGMLALAPTCRDCEVHGICGGGMYAHRYWPGRGFANPSVYCPDLFRLVTHIRSAVDSDLAILREGS